MNGDHRSVPRYYLQSFLDRLESLAEALAIAQEHAQEVQQEFLANSNPDALKQFESSVTKVRILAEKLERQFNRLEYLLATQTAAQAAGK